MALSGAAFGASQAVRQQQQDAVALQELLMQRAMQERQMLMQQARDAEGKRQFDTTEARQKNEFDVQQANVVENRNRQQNADDFQRQQVNLANLRRDDQANVRRMLGIDLGAGAKPASVMQRAFSEGIDLPMDVADPDKAHRESMAEIGARNAGDLAAIRERNAGDMAVVNARGAATGAASGGAVNEAADTAMEIRRIAKQLKAAPGLKNAFGVVDAQLPTILPDTATAEALRNSLTGLLTLGNTGKLKGVLSNADMEILRNASTTLTPTYDENLVPAELDRIIERAEKALTVMGVPFDGGATATGQGGGAGDGTVQKWGRGPDGRPVRLR